MKGFDIKRFRDEKKITQKQLADILRCNQAFISTIEHKKRDIPDDKFYLLVDKYGDLSDYISKYNQGGTEENPSDEISETVSYISNAPTPAVGYISLPERFLDELTKLTETIYSQQRTIEKLVNQKSIN